jgi:hypothetical protein
VKERDALVSAEPVLLTASTQSVFRAKYQGGEGVFWPAQFLQLLWPVHRYQEETIQKAESRLEYLWPTHQQVLISL